MGQGIRPPVPRPPVPCDAVAVVGGQQILPVAVPVDVGLICQPEGTILLSFIKPEKPSLCLPLSLTRRPMTINSSFVYFTVPLHGKIASFGVGTVDIQSHKSLVSFKNADNSSRLVKGPDIVPSHMFTV